MSRKGQAALEFLTTYGWMILIVIAMVGGLSYFGVFNVSSKLQSTCSFDSPVSCPIYEVKSISDDTFDVVFQIENTLNQNIKVVDLYLKNSDGVDYCSARRLKLVSTASYTCDYPYHTYDDSWCQVSIPNQGTSEIVFRFEDGNGDCDFGDANLFSDMVDRKYSFDIGLVYLPSNSDKPIVTYGKMVTTVVQG